MIHIVRAGRHLKQFAVVSVGGNKRLLWRTENLKNKDDCLKNIAAQQRQHEGVTYTPVQDDTLEQPIVFDFYQDGTQEASIIEPEAVYKK